MHAYFFRMLNLTETAHKTLDFSMKLNLTYGAILFKSHMYCRAKQKFLGSNFLFSL
jgi:hypothetical protein